MPAGLAEVFPLKVDILLLLPSPEDRDTVALQGRRTKEKFQNIFTGSFMSIKPL